MTAIFFSPFFVLIELSNLNLKTYCLFTVLKRNIFFLEDSIVNLILSHVSGANFVYFFVIQLSDKSVESNRKLLQWFYVISFIIRQILECFMKKSQRS